MVERK